MFNLFSSETKAYKSLGGQEFKQEYSKSTQSVLIDVRTVGEFSSGSITGAKKHRHDVAGFQKTDQRA